MSGALLNKMNDFAVKRTEEINHLRSMIDDGRNVVVAGKNGIGKQTLVRQAFSSESVKVCYLELDGYLCSSLEDLNEELNKAKVISRIKSVKAATFKENINSLIAKRKTVISIRDLNTEIPKPIGALIDKANNLSVVLHGSTNIAKYKDLFPAEYETYWITNLECDQLYRHYSSTLNLEISNSGFEYLYELTNQNTQLIDQVCWRLKNNDINNAVDKESIETALDSVMASSTGLIKSINNMLTKQQRTVLAYIAKMKGGPIYDSSNLKGIGLSKQQLMQSVNKLLDLGLVIKFDYGKYEINNPHFELWLAGCNEHG